ncbi:sensor histidine kinase [Plantibacter sp. M259]|uniref:sensor histidine kinase n=1 Tax=Plantibacter sp. M259 TaxID=2583822 RepID=UPI001110F614|nr:ATP-binding protein [Plantibacter sp. M259]
MPSRLLGFKPLPNPLVSRDEYVPDDGRRFVVGQAIALTWLGLLRVAFTWAPHLDLGAQRTIVTDFLMDLVCMFVVAAAYRWRNPVFRGRVERARIIGEVILLVSAVRVVMQFFGEPPNLASSFLRQLFVALLLMMLAAVGLLSVDVGVRTRIRERSELEARFRAAEALEAGVRKEEEVRAEIRRRLHGSLQQSILFIEWKVAQLRRVAVAGESAPSLVEGLSAVARDLELLRERDVRAVAEYSRPAGLDLGAPSAIRLMLDRLPSHVSFTVAIEPKLEEIERLEQPQLDSGIRTLVVDIVQEGLTNALKHGAARHVDLTVGLDGDPPSAISIVFDDAGTGMPSMPGPDRGLQALRNRIRAHGGEIDLGEAPAGGARLWARIPLTSTQLLSEPPPG